jgi:hypothetical protein
MASSRSDPTKRRASSQACESASARSGSLAAALSGRGELMPAPRLTVGAGLSTGGSRGRAAPGSAPRGVAGSPARPARSACADPRRTRGRAAPSARCRSLPCGAVPGARRPCRLALERRLRAVHWYQGPRILGARARPFLTCWDGNVPSKRVRTYGYERRSARPATPIDRRMTALERATAPIGAGFQSGAPLASHRLPIDCLTPRRR